MVELKELKKFTFKDKEYFFPKILKFCINPIFNKGMGVKKCEKFTYFEYDIIDFRIPKEGEHVLYGGTKRAIASPCSGRNKTNEKMWIAVPTIEYIKQTHFFKV